jgi:Cu+-exporting ATPase
MKQIIKKIAIASLVSTLFLSPFALARTVEVSVHGMTCAFCVDSLQRKFKKMKAVSKVEVSLKQKKVRLETQASAPSLASIKQAVLDAGFTPTKITIIKTEETSD